MFTVCSSVWRTAPRRHDTPWEGRHGPETYQQSVNEGTGEAARLIIVLGRIVIGAAVVAVCLWVGWLGRGRIVGALNVFFALISDLPRPRPPVDRVLSVLFTVFVLPRVLAVGIAFAVGHPVGWLVTRRLAAYFTAVATVAVGLYLCAFHLVDVQCREYRGRASRRCWYRTRDEMATILAGLSGRGA